LNTVAIGVGDLPVYGCKNETKSIVDWLPTKPETTGQSSRCFRLYFF